MSDVGSRGGGFARFVRRAVVVGLTCATAAACTGDDAGLPEAPPPARPDAGPTTDDATPTTPATPATSTPATTTPATTAPAPTTTVPTELVPIEWPELTGAGVTLAVLDRGVDWRHPDLRHPDGSTRIEAIVDLSGQQAGCAPDRPDPSVYLRADIDAALIAGTDLGHRDAVGHGTASAGLAAGSGAASDGRFRGAAPGVDLVIVKISSEGVPPGDGHPGEEPVAGCIDDALDVLDLVMAGLDQPTVALWNTGTQFGPIDGTSAVSRRIAASFGPDRPGRVWVAPAGDEGGSPGRAGGELVDGSPFVVSFVRPAEGLSNPTLWYSGDVPASVTVEFDDGVVVGPVAPGASISADGVTIVHYEPGEEFHPWTSTSGDRAVWISIDRAAGTGRIVVEASGDGSAEEPGRVDVFGDVLGAAPGTTSIEFVDQLVSGTITDTASTEGAVVVTSHIARTAWIDRTGDRIDQSPAGGLGERWPGASTDPTRDGRSVIAVSAPGHHAFAPLAEGSAFDRIDDIVPLDGDGRYVVFTGTSAAAALVAGVVALALEADPTLTATEVGELLRSTAVADDATGAVPNPEWGHGKLDLPALLLELSV